MSTAASLLKPVVDVIGYILSRLSLNLTPVSPVPIPKSPLVARILPTVVPSLLILTTSPSEDRRLKSVTLPPLLAAFIRPSFLIIEPAVPS